jgi:hypothetical protein
MFVPGSYSILNLSLALIYIDTLNHRIFAVIREMDLQFRHSISLEVVKYLHQNPRPVPFHGTSDNKSYSRFMMNHSVTTPFCGTDPFKELILTLEMCKLLFLPKYSKPNQELRTVTTVTRLDFNQSVHSAFHSKHTHNILSLTTGIVK